MTTKTGCVAEPHFPSSNRSHTNEVRGIGRVVKIMNEMTMTDTTKAVPTLPDAQTVTQVKHWTDRLFSFRVTRPASLRFRSGEFVMIGLMGDPHPETGKQKPLLRAYSIADHSAPQTRGHAGP